MIFPDWKLKMFIPDLRISDIWEELGVELLLLCVERSQLKWFRHLIIGLLDTCLW